MLTFDRIVVLGYALPSGQGRIVKVEVSGDDGSTWTEAKILHDKDQSKWSWTLWSANIKIEPGEGRKIYSRATDAAGNTQPAESQWNLRGVCYNGYGDATDLTIVERARM